MVQNNHNPVRLYFAKDSSVYRIVDKVQAGIAGGIRYNLSDLERRARAEVREMRELLDNSYIFAQDLSQMILGAQPLRTVLLVKGTFVHHDHIFHHDSKFNVESILPIDLGVNPYQLFTRIGRQTADETVTVSQTERFLGMQKNQLLSMGYQSFDITSSIFYNFRDKDLSDRISTAGKLNLEKLVSMVLALPYRPETRIVLNQVMPPTLDQYLKSCVESVSYRFKQTLSPKVMQLCTPGQQEKKERMKNKAYIGIKDWAGIKVVVKEESALRNLQDFFHSSPQIGRSKVELVDEDDYMLTPKEGTGYRALHLAESVSTFGSEPYIVEIKIVTLAQDFANDIDAKSKALHIKYKRTQHRLSTQKTPICLHYEETLNRVLGDPICRIVLKKLGVEQD
jgi:ppGpp synthetase/RelA/SpoT-type nucleotidyltranferase